MPQFFVLEKTPLGVRCLARARTGDNSGQGVTNEERRCLLSDVVVAVVFELTGSSSIESKPLERRRGGGGGGGGGSEGR